MDAVRSIKNQYLGINAHLQSQLQASSDWPEFHTSHISDLMRLMRAQLYPMGYVAKIEKSLQIRRYGAQPRNPRPDALIYDADPQQRSAVRASTPPGSTALVYSVADFLDYVELEAHFHRAVAIYELLNEEDSLEEPVCWIELLSPSNKPGGQDSNYYQEKRREVIEAGLVFVEIDYLHEQAPTSQRIPNYRTVNGPADASVSAYRIVVIDPRPVIEQGYGHLYPFSVDEPLPTVDIPLNGDDVLEFDFGPAYSKTFEEVLYGNIIDYRQLPTHFDRYREDDQARIISRMLAVLEAAQAGRDLEQAPQPIETLPLDEGLRQLETLSSA